MVFGMNDGAKEDMEKAKTTQDPKALLDKIEGERPHLLETPPRAFQTLVACELKYLLDLVRKGLEAQERIEALEGALRETLPFFGDNPCRLDHHGHCQEHGWEINGICASPAIKSLLESDHD